MDKKKKNDSLENNNGPRKDPKITSIDVLKKQYADEMISALGPQSLLTFTKITAEILEDEFEKNCDIERRIVDGNYRLYLTKKGVEKKSQGQLLVVVKKDHSYNIRLNPYSKYEDYYFLASSDTRQLLKEMPTIKGFLRNEKVPAHSMFKKESYSQAA